MVDSNIPILRKQEFTKALQPHLVSPDKTEHLAALSSLAGIVNEEESEIINSNKKVVKHLMKVFRKGLETEERRYDGKYDSWNCKECALSMLFIYRIFGYKTSLLILFLSKQFQNLVQSYKTVVIYTSVKVLQAQSGHKVERMSLQRRCEVLSHRRQCDIISISFA